MTILIGKNSSGKSAVAKLPTLIEGSLSGTFPEPFQLKNDGVSLGRELKDLVYGRKYGNLEFELETSVKEAETSIMSVKVNIYNNNRLEEARIMSWNDIGYHFVFDPDANQYNNIGEKKTDDPTLFYGFCRVSHNEKLYDGWAKLATIHNLRTDYMGSFRVLPQPIYFLPKQLQSIQKMGYEGENAYPLLIADSLTTPKALLTKVNEWYKQNFEGWGVHVNQDKQPHYQIELAQEDNGIFINLADVGQGMSQALPLVVRAFVPDEQDTLIIMEQPELHLHPAAHGNLAELFAQSTIDNPNKHYLIETHSENFVLRLRALVAEGKLKSKDLAIYNVKFDAEKAESNLELIPVDAEGEVEKWPEGIFNEGLGEVMRIRQAQK